MISKNARLGIVYSSAEKSENGVSNGRQRYATIAAATAITEPTPTAINVSSMCSTTRGQNREPKLSKNHLVQKPPFLTTQGSPRPKFGITGPEAARCVTAAI